MVAERQARYPRGTYKVAASGQGGLSAYCVTNLSTGRNCCSNTLWSLIKDIEEDLSANRYPQNDVQYRSWGLGSTGRPAARVVPIECARNATMPAPCGPTFILRVLYRQNATWQGTIQWIEGRQTRQYRSVNELMRLMDEAVQLAPADGGEAAKGEITTAQSL